jgi:hypothetical protein
LFPAPDQLCAHGPEGRFVHELIVPFVRQPQADGKQPAAKSPRSSLAVPRTLAPGSEWLYAKLYTGSATADQLLREVDQSTERIVSPPDSTQPARCSVTS